MVIAKGMGLPCNVKRLDPHNEVKLAFWITANAIACLEIVARPRWKKASQPWQWVSSIGRGEQRV